MDEHAKTFDRRAHCQQIGGLGGRKTVETYGLGYMRAIAAAGFATTADRYYAGNRAHARAALLQRKQGHTFRKLT